MAPYKVYFNRAAEDAFKKLPRSVQQQLQPHIDALATEPRPPSSKLLYGKERTYPVPAEDAGSAMLKSLVLVQARGGGRILGVVEKP